MESKNLFVKYLGVGYEFSATELKVTNPSNVEILRYRIVMPAFDIVLIEQDRYGNWTQLVEKGSPLLEDLLIKIGEAVTKNFPK